MKIQNSVVAMLILIAIFTLTVAERKESAEAATKHIIIIFYFEVIKDINGKTCKTTYLGARSSTYDHEHSGGTVFHFGSSTRTLTYPQCP